LLRRKKWESPETPKRTLKRSRQKPLKKNEKRSKKRKNNNETMDAESLLSNPNFTFTDFDNIDHTALVGNKVVWKETPVSGIFREY
jgi:hypothetical protein